PQGTSLLSGECPLTWTTPAGNGAPIEEYELNHDQGGGPVSVGNVNGYNWIGLTNGTDYRFSLRARNEAGWSEWSDPSGICTPDIVPGRPSAPNILFADQALDVAWTAPPNTGSAIDDYELEIGGGRSSVQPVGTQTSYTWPGLSNGAGYQFRVRAHNGAGWGEWSTWSATEHPLREPDAPAAPTVQRGQQFLDITWPAPADNGDPISNYEIRIAGTGQTFSTGNGSTTSHRWSNLTNGVLYSFEVRAENRAGWGLWGPGSADEKPCDVPDAVGAPSGTAGDQQVTVNWSGPNDQGCAISSYKLHL
ncbi:MAG: fibronectin type III domain-containing protein, partial [Actinomycetia bacterium]|nr:fibronectin type III domain-containing protein [Actinomycetes bacterium]